MTSRFPTLPWHDAILLGISIDREKPGHHDVISLQIRWPDSTTEFIEFYDCYGFSAEMNFGIIADECIASAAFLEHSHELTMIKNKWSLMNVTLDSLFCFRLEIATTASVINIYAPRFCRFKA